MAEYNETISTILDDAESLIRAMGHEVTQDDQWMIRFMAEKAEQEIKNACNVQAVPEGLYKAWVQLTVADFLGARLSSGILDGETIDFEPALKTLQEGDTSITWAADASQTPEQRLNLFIDGLRTCRNQFIRYRRLCW